MQFPWLVAASLGTAALASLAARVTRQYLVAALLGGALILYLHGWVYFHYTADDAYISFRYARNLADGRGLVWNPGYWVEGYTDFLWVVLLAAFDRLGAHIVPAARWLGFACGVVAIGETYALTRTLFPSPSGRGAAFAAAIVLTAAAPFAIWTFAGLETPLFAALVTGAVILHIREEDRPLPPFSGAVWAFSAMTHPDALLLLALSGVFKLGAAAQRAHRRTGDPSRALREVGILAAWCAAFAVIYAPYFAWRYDAYGWLFPNTFYAKVGSGLDQYRDGLTYFNSFVHAYAAWLILVPIVALPLARERALALAYVTVLLLGWFAYIVYIGGDGLLELRFFAPLMPLFCAVVAAGAAVFVVALQDAYPNRRPFVEAALALALLSLMAFWLQSSAADRFVPGERNGVADRLAIGRWLGANMPSSTVIAVIPAGAIPYASGLDTIDMLGINNVHIAHDDLSRGQAAAGHSKYDSNYVLDQRPDMIIASDALTDAPLTRAGYDPLLSNTLIPAWPDLIGNPRLWSEYEMRSVQIEPGKWLNLFARRDATEVLQRTRAAPSEASPGAQSN